MIWHATARPPMRARPAKIWEALNALRHRRRAASHAATDLLGGVATNLMVALVLQSGGPLGVAFAAS